MDLSAAAALLAASLAAPGPARAPSAEPDVWERLPAFVWRAPGTPLEVAAEWVRRFGGLNLERAEEPAEVLESGLLFYVGHGPGREELHLERDSGDYAERRARWLETGETAHLVRDPCLSDPATRARLSGTLATTLAAREGDHGVGVSLGDEVSLTPWGDPVDLCRSPHCEAAWSRRVGDGGDASFPATDDARRRLARGDLSRLGAWLERRRFGHDLVLEVLAELTDQMRERSPGTPVGLLGLTGRTAFGGVAVDAILPRLDFLEAYPTGDARELLFTLRRPEQRALATIILEDEPPLACAWRVWEHWLRGGDGWIVYRARDLERWPEHAAAAAEAVEGARDVGAALRARGFAAAPLTRGAALLHSDDSAALSWLRDAARDGPTWPARLAGYHARNGSREVGVLTWLRLLEDLGHLPGSLPAHLLEPQHVERFPLLVAEGAEVLTDDEVARLGAYLASGGHAVLVGPVGRLDEHGRERAEPPAVGWRERYAERVHARPDGFARYDRARLASPDAGELGAEVGALLERLGAAPPPVRVRGAEPLPWLAASRPGPGGALAVTLLPNLARASERAEHAARTLEVQLECEPGWSLEWVHPAEPPGAHPAHEPLVVVLRPDPSAPAGAPSSGAPKSGAPKSGAPNSGAQGSGAR